MGVILKAASQSIKTRATWRGKGWMELKFDRMFIPPGEIIPISAKVVYVPKYSVDKQGRIHGNGHAVRDTLEWMVPVLWPIDLLTLPRRGPRPVLKPETRLTLKIMDDFGVPIPEVVTSQSTYSAPRDQYGYTQRAPMNYGPPPAVYSYPPPPPMVPVYPRMQYQYAPPPAPPSILVLRNGTHLLATRYWFEPGGELHYVDLNGTSMTMPLNMLDVSASAMMNGSRGADFVRYSQPMY